jgi:long-chain acyl-CoA synthetase
MLRNDPVFVDIIQGCRIAGAHFCQINWHFKGDEAGFILADCGARVLFVHHDLLPVITPVVPAGVTVIVVRPHPRVIEAYHLPAEAFSHPPDYAQWLAVQQPYDGPARRPRGHMAYTSGTTGRPKGVQRFLLPPEQLPAQQELLDQVAREAMGIVPGVRALVSGPLYHSAPSIYAQQALLKGNLLVLEAKFDPERTLALIERHRIESAYLVPVMYVRLLRLAEAVRRRYDLSSLKYVSSTGSPCAPEVKRAMIEWLGPVIFETYASSEAGMVTIIGSEDSLRKPGSAGKPLGRAKLRIIDAAGKDCPPGAVGTIYVRQPAYADFTYHHNDAARRTVEHEGLISMGDMGYVDEEGYLFVSDRASDMVISGGVNIYPAEIEHVLITLPGIADCAVIGIPDDEYGEALAAQVMVHDEDRTRLTPEAIRDWLKERIADYKVPRRIDIVAALPRDDNGKVAKRRIRDAYWRGRDRRI